MSDFDRTRLADGQEERLPWLEAVEEDAGPRGPRAATLVAAVAVALIAIGLVVGGVFLLRDRHETAGTGELIAAPEGSYKVRPDKPGGMKVEGEGDTSFAASAGKDTNAAIDLSAIPETPVAGAGSVTHADAAANAPPPPKAVVPSKPATTAKPVPAPKPTESATVALPQAAPKQTASATPGPAHPASSPPPATSGGAVAGPGTIQLGAFSSEAKANAAWKTLSGRFANLAALPKAVVPATVNGATVYRLRASAGGQASTVCAKLRVAGEACAVVG